MSTGTGGEYTAVIFSSRRAPGADPGDGYGAMAVRMEELARQQPGFVGIESVRDADGNGITVSYFDSDASARAWKQHPEHLVAQRLGQRRWYAEYHLRVAAVEREYGWTRPDTFVHMAIPADWAAAQASGEYSVSTRGRTLADEGFIHCSYDDQIEGVANRYYSDLDELLLLRVDPDLLRSRVVVEPPFAGADDAFPHIYGPIEVTAVVRATPWRRAGAAWELPADF
jgi:uncharacterized protein (DUF952 family)/heme-degrading monooxygenase HmoA